MNKTSDYRTFPGATRKQSRDFFRSRRYRGAGYTTNPNTIKWGLDPEASDKDKAIYEKLYGYTLQIPRSE